MEAKRIEGRSETTLYNYGKELAKMFLTLNKYRSTLATNMVNKGCPVDMVQGILGHSNVNTTLKCYVKIDKDAYKRAHDQYT